jgi:hypothetical protein
MKVRPSHVRCVLAICLACIGLGCASEQKKYSSPEVAASSLVDALRSHDSAQLKKVFGSDGEDIVSSGDPVADRAEIDRFLAAYDAQHRLQTDADGSITLVVGDSDWPFPVPIVKSNGDYIFDTAAGKDEILNRRIGRNELSTEQVCLAIVDAERDYVALNPMRTDLPEYARKIVSEPGKKNGLYWPTQPGEPQSPLGELVAQAADEGYGGTTRAAGEPPPPYHGYCYRLLTSQGPHAPGGRLDYVVDGRLIGGFAVVAYPAQYGNSGIMSFITNHDGVVYQRDLGPETRKVAEALTEFDPGPGWTKATDASLAKGD